MKNSKHTIKRTVLATAMAATLGATALPEPASAGQWVFSYTGWFTMLNPGATDALVNGDSTAGPMYGRRTSIQGTLTFEDTDNTGSITIDGFSFFGSGLAEATSITFTDTDGVGGAGTRLLGNMGFNWAGNNGIPVSLEWDAAGLINAIGQTPSVGDTLGINASGSTFNCGTEITCGTPATETYLFNFGKQSYTLPIGAAPLVTTTFNTTDIGAITLGVNPSGTLPLTDDGIGGSPMKAGPFPNFNANFDFVSMTLTNSPLVAANITAPADISITVAETPPPSGRTQSVDLGAPTNVSPTGTAEYCLTGRADCDANNTWLANNGTNTTTIPVARTVNSLNVDWRADNGNALDAQVVTVTVNDQTPPTINTMPADVTVSVQSISDNVCFSNDTIGHLTASDVWDASPTVEYSLDGFTFFPSNNGTGGMDCSSDFPSGTSFGPNANTVIWRAKDATISGNPVTYNQTVTLNLPTGIVGKDCTVNLNYPGFRTTTGTFIMRDPTGAQVGTTDNGVTGIIDTTLICTDPVCADIGATLKQGQPFQSLDWFAKPVTLYGSGTWTFETCLGTPGGDEPDNCATLSQQPNPLSMTVKDAASNGGIQQLGAHMLFEWGSTKGIDVVVVWDVNCGTKQLTTTDPDGDGIIGSKMVDGPFRNFNASFDLSGTGFNTNGEAAPLIADGGYQVSLSAYKNPVQNSSPLPLGATQLQPSDFPTQDDAVSGSCVGGCYQFERRTTMVPTSTRRSHYH